MIEIKFLVDKVKLIHHALTKPLGSVGDPTFIPEIEPREKLITFRQAAKKLDPKSFETLSCDRLYTLMTLANHRGEKLTELCKQAEDYVANLQQDQTFAPVLADTEKALEKYKDEWLEDYAESFALMKQLTGLTLDRSFNVYITHPWQGQGMNMDDTIFHTYRAGFPHYNTVYMWHEIMHSYIKLEKTNDKRSDWDTAHAVIQLLTDNELRCRLAKSSSPGAGKQGALAAETTYPPFKGHKSLEKAMENLLPSWREYLSGKQHDIMAYLKKAIEIEDERLSKLEGSKK